VISCGGRGTMNPEKLAKMAAQVRTGGTRIPIYYSQ